MKISAIVFFSSIFFSVIAKSDMATGRMAKMAGSYPHKISEIITQFSKKDQNKQVLEMAVLARDVFDIKEINNYTTDHSQVELSDIVKSIRYVMSTQWNAKIPAVKQKKLEANKSILSQAVGAESYEWAWVLNQLGDQVGSKKILLLIFEKEYKAVMAQQHATFGKGGSPLSGIEPAFQALEALCEGKEKTEIKEKMGKAKQHISTLPQSHIMT